MLRVLATLSVLCASSALAAAQVSVAVPNLSGVNIPDPELAFYSEHFATQLGFNGLKVTTEKQIASVLGLERQRALLGCADSSSSCMAELANALGADALVIGSIGKIGKSYQVNLTAIRARDAQRLGGYSHRAMSDEAVLDELAKGAKELAADINDAFKKERAAPQNDVAANTATTSDAPKNDVKTIVAMPTDANARAAGDVTQTSTADASVETALSGPSVPKIAAGAAALAVGVGGFWYGANGLQGETLSTQSRATITDPTLQAQYDDDIGRFRTAKFAGFGVGIAATAAGAWLLWTGLKTEARAPTVAVVPSKGGAALILESTFAP